MTITNPRINAIFATDLQGGMGHQGSMPWPRLTDDLKNFRDLTMGAYILMGGKTWASPDMHNPLPGRQSIVWSRNPDIVADRNVIHIEGEPEICLDLLLSTRICYGGDIWVIGGAETLRSWMPHACIVYHTEIEGTWECDTHYPKSEWSDNFDDTLSVEKKFQDARSGVRYTIKKWVRHYGKTVS
jgi:dihydrofolate reductase